jgi:hypothetical protein
VPKLVEIGAAVSEKKLKRTWKCSNVLPRPGGKTSTPAIMKNTILVEAFLLYITMHSVVLEKKSKMLKFTDRRTDRRTTDNGRSE